MNTYKRHRFPPDIISYAVPKALRGAGSLAIDKTAAKDGAWRTKEGTMHWLSVPGGWPGAMIAQQTLRHKTRKQFFRLVFWITVSINVGLLFWINTPAGAEALEAMLGAFPAG
jgi:uncharacterized membrane protein YsdA (DUF1294 family)